MNFLLFGPPASGKGTQADLLSDHLGVPEVATGNILRAELAQRTELGLEAAAYMNRGDLVPDSLMIEIIRERLRHPDCANGFLLDGFPRTVAQAQELDVLLTSMGLSLDVVLYLKVPEAELVRRTSSRLTCPLCGRSYSFEPSRPRPENCETDGGLLFVRDDDRPETALRRIAVYLENTLPVLDYYRSKRLVHEVDGAGPVEDVTYRLLEGIPAANEESRRSTA